MTYDYQQFRATLEDTIQNQDLLLSKIDHYYKKNIPVEDTKTRKDLFKIIGRATFGIGTKPIKIRLLEDKRVIDIPNFEQFIGVLFYHNSSTVNNYFWFELLGIQIIKHDIKIKDLWKQVRIHLLGVFPEAKANAVRMSKEREQRQASEGASISDV